MNKHLFTDYYLISCEKAAFCALCNMYAGHLYPTIINNIKK